MPRGPAGTPRTRPVGRRWRGIGKSEGASGQPSTWYVFETFVADGSLAIGVAQGAPDPSMAMIVQSELTRAAAHDAAARLAREHRARGLSLPQITRDSPVYLATNVDDDLDTP